MNLNENRCEKLYNSKSGDFAQRGYDKNKNRSGGETAYNCMTQS